MTPLPPSSHPSSAPSASYDLDLDKMEKALSDLTAFVLKTQATGDRDGALAFENKYSKRSSDYEIDLRNLRIEMIPADITLKFKQ